MVPDSVRDPLGYYRNNTINTRALLEVAVATGVQRFIFSSTAAVYGNPQRVPVGEDAPVVPMFIYIYSFIVFYDFVAEDGLGSTTHAQGRHLRQRASLVERTRRHGLHPRRQ